MSRMPEPARVPELRPLPAEAPGPIELHLRVDDPEVLADLGGAAEGEERNRLAIHALRIGLLALRQARGHIDADAVRREGERILAEFKSRIEQHDTSIQTQLRGALREYFDPDSGKLSERVARLVRKDGELEQTMRRLVGEKDSEMARALASALGEHSPVLRILSPTQSDGVVRTLAKTVDDALATQRERILAAFSLDQPGSALSRLVGELRARHGELEKGFKANVEVLRADFSLDVQDSPLSRLIGRVEEAQATIRREFTLDEKGSALARMRQEILDVIAVQGKASADFQAEVRATLAGLAARKEEAARSTRHGLVYEDDVWAFVDKRAVRLGDTPERTGETTGLVSRSKVGDCIVTLGPDRAAAGARIVVEAKEDASYTLERARAEIEEGRKNRGAQVGVFVLSKRTATESFPRFLRRGDDLFVVWDVEDATTDVWLEAALSVAEALCTRVAVASERKATDFEALDAAVNEVEKQAGTLDEIETSARTVTGGAERIVRRVEILRKVLARQVADLRDGLRDLRG